MCRRCSKRFSDCRQGAKSDRIERMMAPSVIPEELSKLTLDEVRLVSLAIPFLKIILLPGGQLGEEGNVIHFAFPVQKLATTLPRNIRDVKAVLCEDVSDIKKLKKILMKVDKTRILKALRWLQKKNVLYKNIHTDTEEDLTVSVSEQENGDSDDSDVCAKFPEFSATPANYSLPNITHQQLLSKLSVTFDEALPFPTMRDTPLTIFGNRRLEEVCFPVLYPRGKGGWSENHGLTDLQYFKHRLFHADDRWRQNPVWIFWALNVYELRKLQSEISIVSRMQKCITAKKLRTVLMTL